MTVSLDEQRRFVSESLYLIDREPLPRRNVKARKALMAIMRSLDELSALRPVVRSLDEAMIDVIKDGGVTLDDILCYYGPSLGKYLKPDQRPYSMVTNSLRRLSRAGKIKYVKRQWKVVEA